MRGRFQNINHRICNHLRCRRGKLHAPPRAITVKPVGHMEILFEMILEREIEEGRTRCRQLHACCKAALHQGQIAGGKMAVEIWHEGADLNARGRIERGRIDARPRHQDHAQFGKLGMRQRIALDNAPDQMRANARATDGDDAHALVVIVAETSAQLGAAAESVGMLADDIAGEIEMLRHPVAHLRQILAERQVEQYLPGCPRRWPGRAR